MLNVGAPDEGLHLCVEGCVPVDQNGSFVIEKASCEDGSCTTDLRSGALFVTATRAGSVRVVVSGRDPNAARSDAFTLTAETPKRIVLVRSDGLFANARPFGLMPGLELEFGIDVRGEDDAQLTFDASRVVVRTEGGIDLVGETNHGEVRSVRAARYR